MVTLTITHFTLMYIYFSVILLCNDRVRRSREHTSIFNSCLHLLRTYVPTFFLFCERPSFICAHRRRRQGVENDKLWIFMAAAFFPSGSAAAINCMSSSRYSYTRFVYSVMHKRNWMNDHVPVEELPLNAFFFTFL